MPKICIAQKNTRTCQLESSERKYGNGILVGLFLQFEIATAVHYEILQIAEENLTLDVHELGNASFVFEHYNVNNS